MLLPQHSTHQSKPNKTQSVSKGMLAAQPSSIGMNILPEPLRVSGLHIFISSLADKNTLTGESEAGA